MPRRWAKDKEGAPDGLVGELVAHSGAMPEDAVTIAGRGSCAMLLDLAARGFAIVEATTNREPPLGAACRSLWLLHATAAGWPAQRAAALRRLQRDGTLVLLCDCDHAQRECSALERSLRRDGLRVWRHVVGKEGAILCAGWGEPAGQARLTA